MNCYSLKTCFCFRFVPSSFDASSFASAILLFASFMNCNFCQCNELLRILSMQWIIKNLISAFVRHNENACNELLLLKQHIWAVFFRIRELLLLIENISFCFGSFALLSLRQWIAASYWNSLKTRFFFRLVVPSSFASSMNLV